MKNNKCNFVFSNKNHAATNALMPGNNKCLYILNT